ncbi:hypothetical protein F5890DRAFT_1549839 [Lentinula detonsa]|uniref:Uncharacterized protein n=1 Tax=Lentinula detonsa TaxID=2804962 RepID=A0AA38Q899_9AGAR|nr:hypothetical protein F5890DRAFT_1549839 [Lentinula detonsa]
MDPNGKERAGVLLSAVSMLPGEVNATPATRTVTVFGVSVPPDTLSIPQPPSTPTVVVSYSVLGTTTSDGKIMTLYGEDIIYSEFVEGQGAIASGTSTSITWSTGTFSAPQTEHDEIAIGASAIAFSHSDGLGIDPVDVVNCDVDSSTGACTEVYWFKGQSTTQTTSWTGSLVPVQTFEVSVSSTATTTNAAGSLKPFVSFAVGVSSLLAILSVW